jgi:flagellar motor switch protein FliN/FliY
VDTQIAKKAAEGFANAFAGALGESLTRVAGSPLQVRVVESAELATRQGKAVHFRLSADGNRGQCFIELYEPEVARLGAKILSRPAEAFADRHTEALGKAISSAMAGLTASLASEHGDIALQVEQVEDLAFGGMLMMPLSISIGADPAVPMRLYFDGQLLVTLAGEEKKDAAVAGKSGIEAANLKLVMDVELVMSLRFGQRQLPLREVLELANGSVIELDRQVDDPVELLLDGKVIARGEAVIVDGNYGLRVTEVPQPIASHLGC